MLFRILIKDIKRRRTMNIILLLFVIIASMFTGSGLSSTASVMGGLDHFFEIAKTGDYLLIAGGEANTNEIERILNRSDVVKDFRSEESLVGPMECIKNENDEEFQTGFPMFISMEDACEVTFDAHDEEITDVQEGHVYLSKSYMDANKVLPGDVITIDLDGLKMDLVVDGIKKDAVFNDIHMMGNERFILNERDIKKLKNNKFFKGKTDRKYYIYYIDCDNADEVDSLLAGVDGYEFGGGKDTLQMLYIMDLMIAMVMIVLSVMLIAVSFVILRFSINFTLEEDFREIGVLKAIGLKNNVIRGMNAIKYMVMAIVGSFIGFFGSVPIAQKLVESTEGKMVLETTGGVLPNIAGAIIVIVLITGYAWHCTARIKKFTPLDAIRYGSAGERFTGKRGKRIRGSRKGVTLFLAVNDILSSPKRYLSILISFFLCTLIVIILDNAENTFKSDVFMDMLLGKGDMVGTYSTRDLFDKTYNDTELYIYIGRMEKKLAEEGIPCRLTYTDDLTVNYEINGEEHKLRTLRGIAQMPGDTEYLEGSAPENPGEIAVTGVIADKYGLSIGDAIRADFGKGKKDMVVCGIFQSFNNTGMVVRVNEDVPHDRYRVNGVIIHFTKDMSDVDQYKLAEKIADICGFEKVSLASDYCVETMGVADAFSAIKVIMLFISFVVVLLVSILMERSFIASEKNQIALMKAIGFNNRSVVRWHIVRFAIIAEAAVLLAAAVSIPLTSAVYSPIFYNMGVSNLTYRFNYLNILVIYPAAVFIETIFMVSLTSLCMRSIKSSDMANIE